MVKTHLRNTVDEDAAGQEALRVPAEQVQVQEDLLALHLEVTSALTTPSSKLVLF
ncbi:hypothetical protein BS78_07G128000 [Paspalum vaginatum]|nr:hypothetical protein BS78_07G128000 [Paspalum vaginatum]KAJ1268351.1 hypothetical protein BS78_07G128000 [Paspalum vaginatum]